MAPIVIIALLIGLPIVLIFFLKANAAMVFLALCAGSVLAQFISSDTTNVFSSFFPANGSVNSSYVQLGLLYTPAFFTALFLRKGVSGAKAMFNLVLAVATGVASALLALPLLPGGVRYNITSSNIWPDIEQYQAFVIAAAVLASLFMLWSTKSKHVGKKHK